MTTQSRTSNRSPQEQLVDNFVDILVEVTKPGEDGKPPNPGAPVLSVIRQFIKDQNLSFDEDKHEGVQQLKGNLKKMPFAERPTESDA